MTDAEKIETFYASENRWQAELLALRAILCASPLTETFKWRSPCYVWEGANVAMPYGFRDSCTLSFFKGVLLPDPEGILVPPGENSRSARVVRFTSRGEIAARAEVLGAYILEAIELEKTGAKVPMEADDFELPDELTEALACDPALAAAWEALTPGRRRGWALQISQAKQTATRAARVARASPRILAGKGMHDR